MVSRFSDDTDWKEQRTATTGLGIVMVLAGYGETLKENKRFLSGQTTLQYLSGQTTLQYLSGRTTLQYLSGQTTLQYLSLQYLSGQTTLQYLSGQTTLQYFLPPVLLCC
jgi:hypothetical protein